MMIKPLSVIDENNAPRRARFDSVVLDERLVTVSDLTSTMRTDSDMTTVEKEAARKNTGEQQF